MAIIFSDNKMNTDNINPIIQKFNGTRAFCR
jgi:hypothetical protein